MLLANVPGDEVTASTCAALMAPSADSSHTQRSTIRFARAYDVSDGSKPGIERLNSSCCRGGLSATKSRTARDTRTSCSLADPSAGAASSRSSSCS